MSWQFVGRAHQIDAIAAALREPAPGPVVITGDAGVGRTSVLRHVLAQLDGETGGDGGTDVVVRVVPADDTPFAALRPHLPRLPAGTSERDTQDHVVRALGDLAGGRRLVIVVDDAHLVDNATVLALRAMVRSGRGVLLITRPTAVGAGPRPDPTDCLRYEPGLRTLTLPPLTVGEVSDIVAGLVGGRVRAATAAALHAATCGSPRRLHRLLVDDGLAGRMSRQDGQWRLGGATGPGVEVGVAGGSVDTTVLVDAIRRAWRELALDRAEELCRLADWCGAADGLAGIRASLLLLRGQVAAAVEFVDGLPDDVVEDVPQVALVKAMGLAFGGADAEGSSGDYLLGVARRGAVRNRALAYRAWLLAMTGRTSPAPDLVGTGDREARLFAHAALATALLGANRAREAVFHLRRAYAIAEACRDTVPWMRPYLRARLIDALLFAGRISEATAVASDFHAGDRSSGWDVVVAIARLTTDRGLARLTDAEV